MWGGSCIENRSYAEMRSVFSLVESRPRSPLLVSYAPSGAAAGVAAIIFHRECSSKSSLADFSEAWSERNTTQRALPGLVGKGR